MESDEIIIVNTKVNKNYCISMKNIRNLNYNSKCDINSTNQPSLLSGGASETMGLTSVYYTEEPISRSRTIFNAENDFIYKNVILYVPEMAVEKCKMIDPWKRFMHIQGYDFPAGIEDVTAGIDETAPCEYFSLSGVKMGYIKEALAPGVYIVRHGIHVWSMTYLARHFLL